MAVTNPIPEYFDAWPHEPTAIIREALREYVGDGDGEDFAILEAYNSQVISEALRNNS